MAEPFSLPPLPYAESALAPTISAQTIGLHYGKHHKTYVDTLNKLVTGTELADQSLEDIIKTTAGNADKAQIFNNAGQVWNHNFYWRCLGPKAGGKPTGALEDKLSTAFGSFDKFKKEFADAAVAQFGSGWAWVVSDNGTLKVVKTGNAESPLIKGQTPLLTIDVWEHSYYLDYQNKRADYVKAIIEKLLNWDFLAENLGKR